MKTKLKGGSLSSTYLITEDDKTVVRKEVSLTENREYGFQRWCSQLKRMQRYSVLFPGVFPSIIKFGHSDNTAYFDMEYVENYTTAHQFLISTDDKQLINVFLSKLIDTMWELHHIKIPSNSEAIYLYLREEVEQRLADCKTNAAFSEFIKYDSINFNGEIVPSFLTQVDKFYREFDNYINPVETFTHGNLTLENILYSPTLNKVVFIDPYEENIIDSVLAEYSQIYQSCNSKYEIYNSGTVSVNGNNVNITIPIYPGLDYFNDQFTKHLKITCYEKQYRVIKLLEISQFIRMLPFKMAIDEPKMILFYTLASKLLNDLLIG